MISMKPNQHVRSLLESLRPSPMMHLQAFYDTEEAS